MQKHRISAYWLFTQMIGPLKFSYVYWCHVFFSVRFLNMCKPRTTFYVLWRSFSSGLVFYGSGLAGLPSWLRMVNSGWLGSTWLEIFLQMKFVIFQGSPTKKPAFFLWWPTPYNQFLIQPLLHFSVLKKSILTPIFLRMSFR